MCNDDNNWKRLFMAVAYPEGDTDLVLFLKREVDKVRIGQDSAESRAIWRTPTEKVGQPGNESTQSRPRFLNAM
jgi:hypothetical protein